MLVRRSRRYGAVLLHEHAITETMLAPIDTAMSQSSKDGATSGVADGAWRSR